MVKIERLPSGSYRARVHLGGGKYKSITGKDKKAVQLEAAQYEAGIKEEKARQDNPYKAMTLGEAMSRYIDSKSAVLSPTTLVGYDVIRRNRVQSLCAMRIMDITQEDIQRAINEDAINHSPKSVRNAHGFISAVMGVYRSDFNIITTLPQRKKPKISIPTQEEVDKLFAFFAGTEMEFPFAMAACCGLRESEISGLRWENVDFDTNTITITETVVMTPEGKYIRQNLTKTESSDRVIRMYPFIREILLAKRQNSGAITKLNPASISHRFTRALPRAGVPHYRFHDLRHYLVSVMLSLNIPKMYIADYVGHADEHTINTTYGHIMASKKTEVEDIMDAYFKKSATTSDKIE